MPTIRTVDAQTLRQWLSRDEAEVIDVRESWEFERGSIKGAQHCPLSALSLSVMELPNDSIQRLVVYCKAGVRSQMACEKLLADGLDRDIWNYKGGFPEWEELGYKVHKP